MRRIVAAMFLTACSGAPASPPAAHPTAPPTVPAPRVVVPAAPAPAAVATAGRLPIDSGDFGSAGPTFVRAVDPGERWMALCQARTDTDGDGKIEVHTGHHGEPYGDAMAPYLVLGGGDGTRIDAFASHSADGRWVAIVRDGKVELVDAQTGDVVELRDADAAADGRPGAPHRAAMFAGNRLLYIRHPATGDDQLVVHDLAGHGERAIAVPGRLWRIDGGGDRLVHVYTVPQGEAFPMLQTTLGPGECLGPAMSYSTYGNRGPTPTEHWLDLDAGVEVPGDGGEVAVGATLVRAPADGALYFGADLIAPPACHVQLLAVLPAPVRAIAICGEHKRAKIVLFGKGLRQELASIDRDTDHYGELSRALAPATGVVCDGGLHCVATATNQYIDLKDGVAEYAWDTKLYVVHATLSSRTHEVIDVATGTRTPIRAADLRTAEGKLLVDRDDKLVDLSTATVVGKAPGAMRVSAAGHVLRRTGKGAGPLRWVAP